MYALTRSLTWFRLCAIAGQSTAVVVCAWLRLPIPMLALLLGIGLLAVFAVFAAWRLHQTWPVHEWETVVHIGVDMLALGYLLYFTGGANNPFITLLLVPIALSAAALSARAILVVSCAASVVYLILLFWYVPLSVPIQAEFLPGGFTLHTTGLAVNFVICAVLLGFFVNRLAHGLRGQQLEVQRVRERALRDEGILAIATQAAGAAHELNTPLSTMRTLLPELRRERKDDSALVADLALLEGQVDRCRTILREMVAFGKAQLSEEVKLTDLGQFVRGCVERFQLLRPEAELTLELDPGLATMPLRVPQGLRHALLNLLNNALDASASRGSQAVALSISVAADWLQLSVRDAGPGFGSDNRARALGQSGKQTGLGIGLTLADATAERLNGELIARNSAHGADVCLRLPLAAISDR